MKKQTLPVLKKKAWNVFSKYIRVRNTTPMGYVKCYTCGTVKLWKELQAGHGIGGRNNAVLFDERIVRPQCVGCNVFGGGKYAIFTRKLIDELGLKEYDKIVTESNQIVKYTKLDYLNIEAKYKELFEKELNQYPTRLS